MSILPVHELVYGSGDGGHTVFTSHHEINQKMARAAARLNLKEHRVGQGLIHSAADVEVHLGTDQRYYMLDFARTFPPEAPSNISPSRQFLYQVS